MSPNPANDFVQIVMDNNTIYAVVAYDITGRAIPLTYSQQSNIIVADVQTLPAGNYMLQVIADDKTGVGILQKQ